MTIRDYIEFKTKQEDMVYASEGMLSNRADVVFDVKGAPCVIGSNRQSETFPSSYEMRILKRVKSNNHKLGYDEPRKRFGFICYNCGKKFIYSLKGGSKPRYCSRLCHNQVKYRRRKTRGCYK